MSFLKDFKDDLSQAVSELMPQEIPEGAEGKEQEAPVDMKGAETIIEKQIQKEEKAKEAEKEAAKEVKEEKAKMEEKKDEIKKEEVKKTEAAPVQKAAAPAPVMPKKEEPKKPASQEVATITAGTRIRGDVESDGSLEILGVIEGNVTCSGKLTITGTVTGDSTAEEIFADSAKVDGQIKSSGAVKIGLGSIILGNVEATSAVVAGAIQGDIDVQGPVVVDSSAVVMGNIKSRSVQINNGAVIEGFCSQCYSDIDVKSFFEENKVK